MHASSTRPFGLAIHQGSSQVVWLSPNGIIPVIQGGQVIYGSAVACRDDRYGLIIDDTSGTVVEIGPSSPLLRPSHLSLISPASNVYISEHYGAAMCASNGEVRVWDHGCVKIVKPARIVLKSSPVMESDQEWMEVNDDHFVKNVSHLSLPTKFGAFGYTVDSSRPHILIRFSLSVTNEMISTIIGEPLICMQDRSAIVSLSQNDSFVYVVDDAGNLFQIPHGKIIQSLDQYKILAQVRKVSVSNHHCAAILSVRKFCRSLNKSSSTPSLQRACSVSIMESQITIENVCRIILSLLDRAVVDLHYLLDYAYSLFSTNRALIQSIAERDFNGLQDMDEFNIAEEQIRIDGILFSEALIRTRAERTDGTLVVSPQRGRLKPKEKTREVVAGLTAVESVPFSCAMLDPQETTEDEIFNIDDSFVPLDVACQSTQRKEIDHFRVRKWTKCGNVFKEPSLVSPVIAPWSSPNESFTVTVPDLSLMESRKSKNTTPSRWYRNEHIGSQTVLDAMREAIEEREVAEAIRLVAEFEARERNRARKNRKRHAQFNSIIVRH